MTHEADYTLDIVGQQARVGLRLDHLGDPEVSLYLVEGDKEWLLFEAEELQGGLHELVDLRLGVVREDLLLDRRVGVVLKNRTVKLEDAIKRGG